MYQNPEHSEICQLNKTERTFSTLQIRVKVSFCVFQFTYNQIFGVFRGCSGLFRVLEHGV